MMENVADKVYLTTLDIEEMVEELADYMLEQQFDYLIGVTRGGLIPAVMLSHRTGIPMTTVQCSTRDNIDMNTFSESIEEDILAGKKVCFIDDINDSGKTLAHLEKSYTSTFTKLNQVQFAVLIDREDSIFNVHKKAVHFQGKEWIVFPWEKA